MSQNIREVLESNTGNTLTPALIEGLLVQLHPHIEAVAQQGIEEGRKQARLETEQPASAPGDIEDVTLREPS